MTDLADVDAAALPTGPTMPEGWAAGMWRLTGHSDVGGWLLIPAAVDDPAAWVEAQRSEMRAAWGERWEDEWADVISGLLAAGLEARPEDAALAFQLWPVPGPLVAQVSASFGARPDVLPSVLDDGQLYRTERLGDGVLLVRTVDDEATGIRLFGTDILFASDDAVVLVRLEPTLPELHAMLISQFHAFVHTLQFVGPDGTPVRATAPEGMLAARSDADWSETAGAR